MANASWVSESEGDRTLEENWLFQLRRERYRSRGSGKAHDFYVMHLADSVNVVALTPDRRVILVRQFRAGSRSNSLETPGGLLEFGEDPCMAGARELVEETGYAGDAPSLLGTVWSNPSLLTSKSSTILITGARRVREPELDHGEEVQVELVPASHIPRMIASGAIDHALAVNGLLWWLMAELPGTPLALVRRRTSALRLRIATLMGVVVVAASFAFAIRYRLDSLFMFLFGLVALLPTLALFQFLVPAPWTAVGASTRRRRWGFVAALFTMIGLYIAFFTIGVTLLSMLEPFLNSLLGKDR